jgi:hypothetical protein
MTCDSINEGSKCEVNDVAWADGNQTTAKVWRALASQILRNGVANVNACPCRFFPVDFPVW